MLMRFCDVWYATFLHILVGILDGVFALSCMRNFSLGYVLKICMDNHRVLQDQGFVCIMSYYFPKWADYTCKSFR